MNWMRRVFRAALSSCVVYMIVAAGPAAAAETHLFDPTLSLTGDCSTSTFDPVADPGCPAGVHPPSGGFAEPSTVAIDGFGDLYVASHGPLGGGGAAARVDIFNSSGVFLNEIAVSGVREVAVDSAGNLYTYGSGPGELKLLRYTPEAGHYDPAKGEIEYQSTPVTVISAQQAFLEGRNFSGFNGIAVDSSNDHLYVNFNEYVAEYGSAAEGNPLIDETIGLGQMNIAASPWVTVDGRTHDVYVGVSATADGPAVVKEFEGQAPHALIRTISGFSANQGQISIAVDEQSGHVFVDDIKSSAPKKKIYEFPPSEENQTLSDSIAVLEHHFSYESFPRVAVANSPSPIQGYLFVPIGGATPGHLYAFEPIPPPKAPKVESESVFGVTQTEAGVEAAINPDGSPTEYFFQVATAQAVEEEGFASAAKFAEGSLSNGTEGVKVSASASGLQPATAYVLRVVAESECEPGGCSDERQVRFTTFPSAPGSASCPNESLRVGSSAALPDCRAYELVTPGNTDGRATEGIGYTGQLFPTLEATADGSSVSFLITGGSLPGTEATGGFNGDDYLANRTAGGWRTSLEGPNGAETEGPLLGGVSADHGFLFWNVLPPDRGSALLNGKRTDYVRYPDGTSQLVGRGSLAEDQLAVGKFIAKDGTHIVFTTEPSGIQLEPDSPPAGTIAVYDRTPDETTHVVSLLPGNVTPAAGQNARYVGVSADGSAVAFEIGSTLYLRRDDAETIEVVQGASAFAGVSEDGGVVSYAKGGNLFSFDAATATTTPLTSSGDATFANVSGDGSHAYFVSPSVLPGSGTNPNGDSAQLGAENLYVSDGTAVRFVATVTKRDVEGEFRGEQLDGLGLWTSGVEPGGVGIDPSRTNPDGTVLLFTSRADLTEYDSQGHAEVYRYDSAANLLTCLSCNPTMLPALSESSLASVGTAPPTPEPFSAFAIVPNLRADGLRVFFQTSEALVTNDTDGLQDVYEWEEDGVGSCTIPGGCVYLITSGHSARNDYLYGASASGDDVFFTTSDRLLPLDFETTPSIYDARRDGGFVEEAQGAPCEGEGCRPQLTPPPPLPAPASNAPGGDEAAGKVECPKGKRKVVRQGKVRCVKRRHRHHRHPSRRGAGR
jgi:hypothetical protein